MGAARGARGARGRLRHGRDRCKRQAGALDGKNVGVIICTNQNPFCAAWANSVKSGLEKQGASVTVLSSVFDPAVDAQNMNRLIADQPDLIISVPASASAIVPSYIRAKSAGIPILGAIGRQSAAGAKIVTAEARTDDPALGRYAAMNLVEGMKKAGYKTGNVIALTGTASQNNVTDRMATFKAYLKKFPQYKIVSIQDTNWDQATSAKVAQQLLSKYGSKGGIQGAYGMADNMAIGIIQGAKQAGVPVGVSKKNGLIVTGIELPRGRHQVHQGRRPVRHGHAGAAGRGGPRGQGGDADPERGQAAEGLVRQGVAHHQGERRQVHEALHLLAIGPTLL